jgi:hypothetical protein
MLVLLVGPNWAWGFGGTLFRGTSYQPPVTSYYYYPGPVMRVVPVVPATPADPCPPGGAAPLYAVPVPAAPSPGLVAPRTQEPPRHPLPEPGVRESSSVPPPESRSYYDGYPSTRSVALPTERCEVGFWNLSGRDLVLTIDGMTRFVPHGRNVRMDLPREFAWRVDNRPLEIERIPRSENCLEIVIRR